MAKNCENCCLNIDNPPKVSLNPWPDVNGCFERLHIDYMSPFLNKYFLVVLDAHSKWLEVFPTTNITSSFTIKALLSLIARFGIPSCIVSDNATNFTSSEFRSFLQKFNIRHVTSPPYFPQSNGAA